ncbi:prolyl oligopeptidase family serine peptidase [Gimesia fumaroli]|uniref:Prolyl endopeptidase n=1 Tax=Gimesia fumaroli TaxID=2527976 RepID=A0A518IG06_9PLAN|nr:prolyl oligopeptidase family serine peptidase [Gimesia fumaroli]QDV52014.1 Prolyl endopeptidase precursor [Gimesia fumaroli]
MDSVNRPAENNTNQEEALLWLEEIEGEQALNWVMQQNDTTLKALTSDPRYQEYEQEALEILTASDRITYGTLRGDFVYNFWRDKEHVRGIWRRTSLKKFRSKQRDWETLLDIDQLAKDENENWIYKGVDCLAPDYDRCIIELAPGGTDTAVYREFDIPSRSFVKEGFEVPLAKTNLCWENQDQLLIATDWGEGSLNTSGYARILKRWKRGAPLSAAETLLETGMEETFIYPVDLHHGDRQVCFVLRGHDFYHFSFYLVLETGDLKQLPLPEKASISGLFQSQVLVELKEEWRGFKPGALVSFSLTDFQQTGKINQVLPLFDPGQTGTISQVRCAKDAVYITGIEHVSSQIRKCTIKENKWQGQVIPWGVNDVISINSSDSNSNHLLISRDGFLQPSTLYYVDFSKGVEEPIQSTPARFDTSGLKVEKNFAISKDGTDVPYFIVYREDIKLDHTTPVLQYGYGGFEISILPHYSPLLGKLWLEKGGAYVLANIRGGGEYGPRWHDSALLENRQRAFDDFYAVAEAVQSRGFSSPRHYGAMGRSNGGLLMGVAFTQRPELFNAIVCGVPLLDMRRFNKLLAGASWMAEYGNPDLPEQWAYLQKYSPLQNLKEGQAYPKVYFFTSTKDDRVHPGHARKMAARMEQMGYDFYYYENIEGGHKGTANQKQEAMLKSLEYLYLIQQLT